MEAQYALGYLLLLTGRLQEGWQGFEARRQIQRMQPLQILRPLWDGSPVPERRVLLHAEEGLGDTIQFCRFVPLLAERARIVFGVPQALVRLLAGLPGIEQIVTMGDPAPAFDMHLPLLSAPHVLSTTLETIPAAVPYLHADPDQVADWHGRLRDLPGLRIGLAWAGNPHLVNDRRRSIPLDRLAALADVSGVSFVSLQKGAAASQVSAALPQMVLHDWTDRLVDFADTAALIENLDLVISVDTSVLHLAGALGKPVWLLNRFDTDWRWLLDRNDSPWYPTLRQFRQPQPGDWDAVVQAVRVALAQVAAEGRAEHTGDAEPPAHVTADLLQRGVAEHMAGHFPQAERFYRRVLAAVPAHADAQHLLGVLLHQTGRSEEAIRTIEHAIELEPAAAQYHNNLGNILRDLGRMEEACACYRRALPLQPDLPDLHHNLGKALAALDEDAQAETAFCRALQLRPDDFDVCNDLGNLLTKMDRAMEAIDLFGTALRVRPESPMGPQQPGSCPGQSPTP